jgi:levanbiose-producing levanase
MTLPRELTLIKEGDSHILLSSPVKEVESIISEFIKLDAEPVSAQKTIYLPDIEASQYDIQLTFKISGGPDSDMISDFGITLENKAGQQVHAGLDMKNSQVFVDRSESGIIDFSREFPGKHTAPYSLSENGLIKFRAIIDKSSIELFVDDGRVVMTELFFPEEPFNSLSLYSNGGVIELSGGSISSVKSCW